MGARALPVASAPRGRYIRAMAIPQRFPRIRALAGERHALTLALALIVPGLALDTVVGFGGQALIGAVIWIAVLAVVEAASGERRVRMLACLALATAGELFLSLVWGLYDYRLHNVPLFVPPGHLLLMLAGMQLARRSLPEFFTVATAVAVLAWAMHAAWSGESTLDVALAVLCFVCLACAREPEERRLYAIMLWLALALEFYGTWLGTWTWRPVEPWFGMTSANPPLAAGAFYCALDALSLWVARGLRARRGATAARFAWSRRL
jgi:hypothetical protein